MAGMLPGVEAARRRRFHHTNVNSAMGTMRRTSFCLHAISTYQSHSNASMRNIISSQQQQQQQQQQVGLKLGLGLDEDDENRLCAAAREAKKRLDHKFQPHYTSHTNRVECRTFFTAQQRSSTRSNFNTDSQLDNLSKPKGTKSKKNWLKLIRLKSSEQDECSVCLEHLTTGRENLIQLTCGHRFHTMCLVPWLEGNANNAHCPYCRMEISS